jgi:hypothetical protein
MGNNPTKEARAASHSEPRHAGDAGAASSSHRPSVSTLQSNTSDNGKRRGSSRHEISLFRIGGHHDPDLADPSARRETRAEREARKREKERELRALERDRSMKEEGVDGGFLVTLGTYTGPEDFSKTVVRQLMIERRLAPFWKGLQDHEDNWVDNQLVAAARGDPIPEPGLAPTVEQLGGRTSSGTSSVMGNSLTVPTAITTSNERPRSPSNPEHSASLLFGSPPSSFRTRARTLVSLSTPRNNSQSDMTPTEIQLPHDPYVHNQPLEAFLYRHASECPICFLYYPPYLNKTRCCDQPICSECFVQIKRPDPHPPEHHDDPDNPNPASSSETEYELVSEVATCPFCKQPEFGVTYDSPPFRRGLAYNDHHRLGSAMSAMSSSSSVNSQSPSTGNRRRATSLAADAPNVITTDLVRPDWRKKLDDARGHALRRAAAATALHNAAYMLGNTAEGGPRLAFGRRRRTLFGEPNTDTGERTVGGLGFGPVGALLAAADRHGSVSSGGQPNRDQASSDLFPGRGSSRRSRIEDLEELMYMEAIRLSLNSAEEESKKQDKEEAKKAKKEEKQKAKDAKKAAKERKRSGSGGLYSASVNESSASGFTGGESSITAAGKGKAPASSPSPDRTNTAESSNIPKANPQAFLEQSRANIQSAPVPVPYPQTNLSSTPPAATHRQVLRHLSNASSLSSLNDSQETSPNASGLHVDQVVPASASGQYSETPPGGGAGTEPMFNFRSLAAVIGDEEDDRGGAVVEHLEHAGLHSSASGTPSPLGMPENGESSSPPRIDTAFASAGTITPPDRPLSAGERLFGVASPSSPSSPPRGGLSTVRELSMSPKTVRTASVTRQDDDGGIITPTESNPYDAKHYGDISILDTTGPFRSAR